MILFIIGLMFSCVMYAADDTARTDSIELQKRRNRCQRELLNNDYIKITDGTSLMKEDWQNLAQLLEHDNVAISSITLNGSCVANHGIQVLAPVFAKMAWLQEIYLRNTSISDDGVCELCTFLQNKKGGIRHVDLRDNEVGLRGLNLVEALRAKYPCAKILLSFSKALLLSLRK